MVARHLVRIRIAPFQSTLIPNSRNEIKAIPRLIDKVRDSITKCKIFVLNSHHIFDAQDLMADWGWGFTNPQPLPNPILSRAKGNFQLAIQKKGDRSLPEIN